MEEGVSTSARGRYIRDFWRTVDTRQQEEGKFVLFGGRYIVASKRKVISYFLEEGVMEERT